MKKTYIIARDEYMGTASTWTEFVGTWEDLVDYLVDYEEWRADPDVLPESRTLEGKLAMFNDGNGDGQPYTVVWCVEDRKKVLG